jgi:transcriptional regulator with XRE-family HTH domain
MIANDFGMKLKKIRQQRGMSMTELASRSGFSRTSIYNWESGKRVPNFSEVKQVFANIFAVSPAYFDFDKTEEAMCVEKRIQALERNMKKVNELLGLDCE